MSRTSQNGSVISFVVVGVLLTAAVLGGLYVVNERNFFGLGSESSEVAQAGEEAGEDVAGTVEEAAADDVVVDTDEPAQAGDQDQGTAGEESSAGAPEAPATDTTTDSTDTSDEAAASDGATSEQAASGTDAVAADDSSSETEEMATTGFTGDTARTGGAAELPTTGPSDTVLAMLGISSLVAAVLMYRRSTQL